MQKVRSREVRCQQKGVAAAMPGTAEGISGHKGGNGAERRQRRKFRQKNSRQKNSRSYAQHQVVLLFMLEDESSHKDVM